MITNVFVKFQRERFSNYTKYYPVICILRKTFETSYWFIYLLFQGANFRHLEGVRVCADNKVEWDPDVKRVYLASGKPLVRVLFFWSFLTFLLVAAWI